MVRPPVSTATVTIQKLASHADVKAVLALASAMHAEGAYAFLPFDSPKVLATILACATQPDHFAAIAVREVPVGFLAGRLSEYPFCREKLAHELGFFVAREARRSTAAARLLRAFRAWALERGAREVTVATSTGHEVDRVDRFLEHMGFARVGGVFRARLSLGI
jgi:GNAT superfamily N-acetyltransferase